MRKNAHRSTSPEEVGKDLPTGNAHLRQIVAEMSDGVVIASASGEILWANACALALYGISEVGELGGNAEGFRRSFELFQRNKHPLAPAKYPLDRLVAGDGFREVVVEVVRVGHDQRFVHRLRGLVLDGPDGRPDRIVMIVNDETERVQAEERFERMFNANPAPAAILRLHDLRFVRINAGFAEMTGYHVEDVVGRSVYEIDVLEGAARRELAIERMKAGRTIPQMEALLQLPGGGEKCVLVAGQPIEVGDTHCMLFTFADLDGRQQALAALRQSEARFETAFRLTPVPTLIAARQGMRALLVNDALLHDTGFDRHDVIGSDAARMLWSETDGAELEKRLSAEGRVHGMPLALMMRAGGKKDVLISAEAVAIRDQDCVLLTAMDVSTRERSRDEIARAIGAVMGDTRWLTDVVMERLGSAREDAPTSVAASGLNALPPRARQIVELVCEGSTDDEIASRLGVTHSTVRNHLTSIYRRTNTQSRAKLMIWAKTQGG